ncbi:hypothetical protein D9M71_841750 [compost metagenome]
MTIGNVMTGVMVEFRAEETGTTLACASAIPAEAHDIEQKIFQFRSVVRSDQDHVAGATLIGEKTAVWATRLK